MSDSLEQRLNRHSDAFQGLLSLIPAKYYFDEETANQWQRKKTSKRAKREAKKLKLDPEAGFSAADEAQRRAEAALAAAEESDSDISVIYDDNGNEIRLKPEDEDKEEDHSEQKQPQETATEEKPEPVVPAKADEVPKEAPKEAAKEAAKPQKKVKKQKEPKAKASKPENTPQESEAVPENTPQESEAASKETTTAEAAEAKKGVSELRQKLLNRINQLRSERKAPGTNVPGAARSREELLKQRKERLDQKKLKRKRDEPEVDLEEDTEQPDEQQEPEAPAEKDDIMFGGVSFKDGQKVGKDLSLEDQKKLKKRNVTDQLKVIENRKKKLEELDGDKRAEIEDKAKWSRLILQSEGAKLKDDEKLLRKSIKQKQNQKLKSEKEWNERKRKVADGIASREAKRNQNIANHTLIKQAKGKKLKKKLRERAGFEGKKRRKN